jgi:hypothetical protein
MTTLNAPTPADLEALARRYQQGSDEADWYALVTDAVNLFLLHTPCPTNGRTPLDALCDDLQISLGWRWGEQP